MNVLIIGAGMVGSNLGRCLRLAGHDVYFNDINYFKISELKYEGFKQLGFQSYNNSAYNASVVFICVPTPTIDGKQDLTALKVALNSLLEFETSVKNEANPKYLFVKSTVLPGTMRKIIAPLMRKSGYILISNPEFLTEADPINSILNGHEILGTKNGYLPDYKIVKDKYGFPILKFDEFLWSLYPRPLFKGALHICKWEEAELMKYASNFILASRISAWNQIKLIGDKLKVDTHNMGVFFGRNDKKIGEYGTIHGKSFGGHCLPKDVEALLYWSKIELKEPAEMIEATHELNRYMKKKYGENMEKHVWN